MLLYHRRVTESALIHQSWRTRKGKWKIMDTVVWFPQEATSQIKGDDCERVLRVEKHGKCPLNGAQDVDERFKGEERH
jgi:hypothetical protein